MAESEGETRTIEPLPALQLSACVTTIAEPSASHETSQARIAGATAFGVPSWPFDQGARKILKTEGSPPQLATSATCEPSGENAA